MPLTIVTYNYPDLKHFTAVYTYNIYSSTKYKSIQSLVRQNVPFWEEDFVVRRSSLARGKAIARPVRIFKSLPRSIASAKQPVCFHVTDQI